MPQIKIMTECRECFEMFPAEDLTPRGEGGEVCTACLAASYYLCRHCAQWRHEKGFAREDVCHECIISGRAKEPRP